MPKLTIDGVEIEASQGQTVLQAALEHGIYIPHLCYHPRLEIAGNCRMCLIEIEKVPKLQIACGTQVRDGMVVFTKSEKVIEARKAVLEFLLINHPLDCPICDQCGECKLQDYCFEYGRERSRFTEEKNDYPVLDVGPDISRNMKRCIHCTRCIRFLRDVAGSEELTLSERGHHATVGPYLEKAIESDFSLNLAEVCPVGALTSRHFRFKGRSWLMQKTRTLCAGCSRNCNCWAWTYQGKLLRLTAAENDSVNNCWLCNPGHRTIERVAADDRILSATRENAIEEAAGKLRAYLKKNEAQRTGILLSARLTNEDAYSIGKLAREVIGTKQLALCPAATDDRPFGPTDRPLPEWFIRKDKHPNSRGVADILSGIGGHEDAQALLNSVASGELRALLIFGGDPVTTFADDPGVADSLENLEFLMVVDSHETKATGLAHLVVPEATPFEKDGTFTNEAGRLQKLRAVLEPAGSSQPAWRTAQALARHLDARWNFESVSDIDKEIGAKVPGYQKLDYDALEDEGILIVTEKNEKAEAGETEKEGDPDARVDPVDSDQ